MLPALRKILLIGALLLATGQTADAQRSFVCEEPIPEFTLGPESDPTDSELKALCACIWAKLGDWERGVSAAISRDEEPTKPFPSAELNVRAFIPRFQDAMINCGGYGL